jgi:chromosome segregation ATPase
VISASWADVEAWAREQLDAAREAIRTSDQRRRELDERQAALDRATAAFEPHRAALTAADRTSRHARDAVAHAKRRLDVSRLRDRRSDRSEVITAERALEAATRNLNRIQPTAGVLRDEYVDAVARHESARRAMVPTEILDQWNDYRGRVDQLEQLLDSLDTWKRWAHGHDVPRERLSESAAMINHFAASRQHQQAAEIAAAVGGWSRHTDLALPDQSPGPQQVCSGLARRLSLEL